MIFIALINIAFIFLFAWMIFRADHSSIRKFYWPALLFKSTCGMMMGLLYTHYYTTGDTILYFDDGVVLARAARNNFPSYLHFLWNGDHQDTLAIGLNFSRPRALFFSKVTSVLCLITYNNYVATALYFSFLSFISAWTLARKIVDIFPGSRLSVVLAFLFFPSVVFWTSGLIKESLAMASLYFLVFIFLKMWVSERVRIALWLAMPAALWLLWNLKYYYMAVLLPVLITAIVLRKFVFPFMRQQPTAIRLLVWVMVFAGPLYIASLVHPNFYPERFLTVIVKNYEVYTRLSAPEDRLTFDGLQSTPGSVIQHAPAALFAALYKPFLWQAHNTLQLLAALENAMLIILTLTSLYNLKKVWSSNNRLLLWSVWMYVVLLAVFLALSTPNFGTLSRYRAGFLPFFILLIGSTNPVMMKLERLIQRWF